MKPPMTSEPKALIATTLLLMFLSVSLIAAVGLASGFESPAPPRPIVQGSAHFDHSSQRAQQGALRVYLARWATWIARIG